MNTKRDSRILAGIVLYNPVIEQLRDNILALISQIKEFVFVDNESKNRIEIHQLLDELDLKYHYIQNKKNVGIARALNQICEYAENNSYAWVLTMDQDSICPNNMVSTMLNYSNDESVAIISPRVIAIGSSAAMDNALCVEKVEQCITSGSLTSVGAWRKVGCFDEWMFIDRVDYDFCRRIILNGYEILQINDAILTQHFGSRTKAVNFLGIHTFSFSYSPARNYYFVRNGIYYIRKYGKLCHRLSVIRGIFVWESVILLHEKNKIEKMKAAMDGIIDGMRVKVQLPIKTLDSYPHGRYLQKL